MQVCGVSINLIVSVSGNDRIPEFIRSVLNTISKKEERAGMFQTRIKVIRITIWYYFIRPKSFYKVTKTKEIVNKNCVVPFTLLFYHRPSQVSR